VGRGRMPAVSMVDRPGPFGAIPLGRHRAEQRGTRPGMKLALIQSSSALYCVLTMKTSFRYDV
jgi:hypothetical protein